MESPLDKERSSTIIRHPRTRTAIAAVRHIVVIILEVHVQVRFTMLLLAVLGASASAQPDTAWVRRYNGTVAGTDNATELAVDAGGSVYVTGASTGAATGLDFYTVKYTAGNERWASRYNGPGNGDDGATAIAVDSAGYVYVAGYSLGSGTGKDYAVVKYDPAGTEIWVRRYNGSGNGYDAVRAIALDDSGAVLVTGMSVSGSTNDYCTVKYSSDGVERWVRKYNGPGSASDAANDIAVDAAGNVYVTGNSDDSVTDADYCTIKYSPSGTVRWVRRYDGPGNSHDAGRAIATDSAGNVYVTGEDYGTWSQWDYCTIKYDSAGNQQWLQHYNCAVWSDYAKDIAVDGAGNVFVTGTSVGSMNYDYCTIKYSQTGSQRWVHRYDGPSNANDGANALALDATGSVCVAGASPGPDSVEDFCVIKYDSAGVQQWIRRYNGPGNGADGAASVGIDDSGGVYVCGSSVGSGSGPDYCTIAYSPDGTEQWVKRYEGNGNADDQAQALVLDSEGNVCVAGSSRNAVTGSDFCSIKYDPDGAEQWTHIYDSPGNAQDVVRAIAVGPDGSVLVTGSRDSGETEPDFCTVKYGPDGTEQWVRSYDGPGGSADVARAIVVDASGNVCVAGESYGLGSLSDFCTIKYSPTGVERWVRRYDGPQHGYDVANALALDAAANVYVIGASDDPETNADYCVIKYDSAGQEKWIRRYDGPDGGSDEAVAVVLDGAGNVVVTGASEDSATGDDYCTVKYDSAGIQQWVQRYNGPDNDDDHPSAIASDRAGNLYVTGGSQVADEDYDYCTIKYGATGVQQWVRRYDGPANGYDWANAMSLDAAGNVVVAGGSAGSGTGSDYCIVKYDSAGNVLWTQRFDGPGGSDDVVQATALDVTGLYVTGPSVGSGTNADFCTIKLVEPVGVTEGTPAVTLRVNTFPTLACGAILLGGKPRAARLLDISGRKVQDLKSGANDVRAMAPGVYFILDESRAESPKPRALRKVILTR
jgi:uncharacterized delta-60 repeat protein